MVLIAGCKSPPLYPINAAPVEVSNEFSRQNPGYKARAGTYYDQKYIAPASKQFFDLCSIPRGKRKVAKNIVQAYSYDYLDVMVRLGGPIPLPVAEHIKLVNVMNDRFRTLLNESDYTCYLSWRDATSGENDFAFLTKMPNAVPVPIKRKEVRVKDRANNEIDRVPQKK